MRLLLDTHVVIWLATDASQQRVPSRVKDQLYEAAIIAASVVSGWEYGMLRARGRAPTALTWEQLTGNLLEQLGFPWACHAYAETLPPIHADPFDRMLIAQALHGGWTLVTADQNIRRYPVPTIW